MMDIGFWVVTVLLTKAVYYYAVRIIHKDYGRQKAIRMTAIVVAVSLIADGAAFFVPDYRVYLLIDISIQFVLVYIWSVIRICDRFRDSIFFNTASTRFCFIFLPFCK